MPDVTPDAVPPPAGPDTRSRATLEIVGLLLLILGFTGLVLIAASVDPLLAGALTCAWACVIGWRLTTSEE